MALARSLDVVVVDRSGEPVLTGLELFEFDGHSRITVDEQRYPDLDGASLIGVIDHHSNQGLDGDTRHLIAIGPEIRDVLAVRALFSDCSAPEPDQSILRRERTEVVLPSTDTEHLEAMTTHETCDGEILDRSSVFYSWDSAEGRYVPDAAAGPEAQ